MTTMQRRRCTSLLPKGNGKTKCGKLGPCTRVRKLNAAGDTEWERWVCHTCRKAMRLPDHDIDFGADNTVFDHMTRSPQQAPPPGYKLPPTARPN